MTKIVHVKEIADIERAANAGGMSYATMMENAGANIASHLLAVYPDMSRQHILVLVGPGNNGGDGLVASHYLRESGADVCVYLSHPREKRDPNVARVQDRVRMHCHAEDAEGTLLAAEVMTADVVIDALLGTGFKLPMRKTIGGILSVVKRTLADKPGDTFLIAVDCPSGLDCDTGQRAHETLRADVTITLAAAKRGHFRFPGAERVGALTVVGIGLPGDLKEMKAVDLEMFDQKDAARLLPARPKDSHKGSYGTVGVVAGSINYPGAPMLAARGAYRAGAGLVCMAVPAPVQRLMAASLPEAVWTLLPHDVGVLTDNAVPVLKEQLHRMDVLVFGPGFGQEEVTKRFVASLFSPKEGTMKGVIGFVHDEEQTRREAVEIPPLVIDADGLRLLARMESWMDRIPDECVLTPHPGEMAELMDKPVEVIQQDRIAAAKEGASTWGQVVVLKGAFTVVAAPSGEATVIPIATSALATAGSGDVLSGVIAALYAQGCGPYEAAALGAYLHARAGELAVARIGDEASVLAGDIVGCLGEAFSELH